MDDAFFAGNSLVEVNVPEDPNLDVEAALSAPEPDIQDNVSSLLPTIPQRNTLYFDESLPAYVVVRVPREDEAAFRAQVARIRIGVEAHVQNEISQAPSKDVPPQRDVIWMGKVDTAQDPLVVMEESAEEDDLSTALLLWRFIAHLSRPRVRMPSPVVTWLVKATLEPRLKVRSTQQNGYLPSGKPVATNLLSALRDNDGAGGGNYPYLSSDRLLHHSAQGQVSHSQRHPLQLLVKAPIRTLPALSSRVRFHRSHKLGTLPTLTASLELEIPPYAPAEVDILAVRLLLMRGQAVELGSAHAVSLPKTCRARDNLVWLYTLSPLTTFDDPTANASSIHLLDVEIDARAIVSDICRPDIKIKWRTNVDFGNAVNTVRGSQIKPENAAGRPLSQTRPESSDMLSPRQSLDAGKVNPDQSEFTLSFVPQGPVYVGEPFWWNVTVANQSSRARQLSLTALQKRKRQAGKRHSHQSSTGSVTAVSKSGAVADASVDENLLYATVKSSGPDVAYLVSVDSDVRVGPLAPGTAAAVKMQFLPLVEGYLQPEAIRITDIVSNEYCDIRQLPSIVAVPRTKPSQVG